MAKMKTTTQTSVYDEYARLISMRNQSRASALEFARKAFSADGAGDEIVDEESYNKHRASHDDSYLYDIKAEEIKANCLAPLQLELDRLTDTAAHGGKGSGPARARYKSLRTKIWGEKHRFENAVLEMQGHHTTPRNRTEDNIDFE